MPGLGGLLGEEEEGDGGHEPDEEDGVCAGEASTDETVGEVIGVALIEGFAGLPTDPDHTSQVAQGHAQNDQGTEHGQGIRMLGGVVVGQDGEDRQQVAHQMTAGIAQEGPGLGEVVR